MLTVDRVVLHSPRGGWIDRVHIYSRFHRTPPSAVWSTTEGVALSWLHCGVRLVVPFVQRARDYGQPFDREFSQVDTFPRLARISKLEGNPRA